MRLNFDKCNVCTGNQGGCKKCSDNPLEHQSQIGSGSLDKQFDSAFGDYKRPAGGPGTKTMTEAEIDKALGIEKKDNDIDEAVSKAFSV